MLRASPLNLETSLRALLAEDLSLALDQALLDTAAADSTRPAGLRSGVAGLTAAASCSRTYISKLEAEDVIQRQGDGFPLDQSRVAYLRTCGASGGIRHAARRTLIFSGRSPN